MIGFFKRARGDRTKADAPATPPKRSCRLRRDPSKLRPEPLVEPGATAQEARGTYMMVDNFS